MGFRNRIVVFVNWAWSYVTYDRASRILRESERRRNAPRRPASLARQTDRHDRHALTPTRPP